MSLEKMCFFTKPPPLSCYLLVYNTQTQITTLLLDFMNKMLFSLKNALFRDFFLEKF